MNAPVRAFSIRVHTDNLLLFPGQPGPNSIDLSKATKLKNVVFQLDSWSVGWIVTALQTITPKHRDLRQITIQVSHHLICLVLCGSISLNVGEEIRGQWLDLDRLLVQFWESRSIRSKLRSGYAKYGVGNCVHGFLPEGRRRKVVDLVE